MPTREGESPRFPLLSQALPGLAGGAEPRLRAFGSAAADLEVDFTEAEPPRVITQILRSCVRGADGEPLAEDFFWSLAVGERLEYLLALAARGGPAGLSITVRCPRPECGKPSEIDFTFEELRRIGERAPREDAAAVSVAGRSLRVRKATGWDQLQWLQHDFQDQKQAAEWLACALTGEPLQNLSPDFLKELCAAVEGAMQEHDPLVAFTVSAQCAECGAASDYEVDLTGALLQRLRERQRQLIHCVHRLARSYHWSEAAIVALPPRRRELYLELIEQRRD